MITSSYDIKQAVSALKKIVSDKVIPILGMVKMFSNGSNVLEMTGTNLEEVITFKIPVLSNPESIDCCVDIAFLKAIADTKDNAVEFILHGDKLSACKLSVKVESSQDFPTGIELGEGKLLPLDSDFLAIIPLLEAVKTDDDTRKTLRCANISQYGCVATDGHQLIHVMKEFDMDYEVNMPLTKLNRSLCKIKNDFQVFAHAKLVRILTDSYDYRVKRNENDYPRWQSVIPSQYIPMTKLSLTDDQVAQALFVTNEVKKTRFHFVTITVDGDKVEFADHAPVYRGETFGIKGKNSYTVGFESKYLLFMLKNGFTDLQIDVDNRHCPVVSEKNGVKYVVMQYKG